MARDTTKATAKRVGLLLVFVCLAPLLAFVAAFGTRFGAWDWRFGHDVLLLQWAWWLALAGGVAALLALVLALGDLKRAGLPALIAVIVSATTIGLFLYLGPKGSDASQPDATTNPADPPAFSARIVAQRAAAGATAIDTGPLSSQTCRLVASDTQVAPGVAAWALQQAGFDVLGFGVGRADGVRESLWFGFTHDATIRIRPGRTDVRVTAREDRSDGGEACRLAGEIVDGLQVKP